MFGVYIHWPFCLSKCPYCDFNSHVAVTIDHAQWLSAYQKEIAFIAGLIPDKIVTSLYFGGGTPSLMKPETVAGVIEAVQRQWRMGNDVEITLEANSTSIEQQKFRDFKSAGVNRVSVGVQALNDKDLKFLGRQHSAEDARQALKIAYETFARVSFDLIYARPGQSEQQWEHELREALTMAKAGHLSLYQLTIEQGTAFESMYQRREFILPDDDLGGRLYEMTAEITKSYGFEDYEISNYARAGEESRHNLTYWHYDDYAGIGPGAHGRVTLEGHKNATRTHRAPAIWLEKVHKNGHAYHNFEKIEPEDRAREALLMGLRLKEGIDFNHLKQECGIDVLSVIDYKEMESLQFAGFLLKNERGLKATAAGRQRLNALLGKLIK
jgi:oxygen-independent coproporphyrinogen-3 oxidase